MRGVFRRPPEDVPAPAPMPVEVLAPLLAPPGFGRRRRWVHTREEAYRLWLLLDAVAARFRDRIVLYLVDPLSPQWVLRVLRHRIRRFPTFLIDGRDRYTGWDLEALAQRIEAALARTGHSGGR